jgi:hypothetical protein
MVNYRGFNYVLRESDHTLVQLPPDAQPICRIGSLIPDLWLTERDVYTPLPEPPRYEAAIADHGWIPEYQ